MRYTPARTCAARSRRCRLEGFLRSSCRACAVFVAAGRGTEVHALVADDGGHSVVRHDECPADRIARHLHAARDRASAACGRPLQALANAVEQPSDRPKRQGQQDREQNEPDHQLLGFCPSDRCADCRLSSARFAACPSGLSGAILSTCFQASVAPSRSCFPNAFTIPTLSSVLVWFESSFSDLSNCASALSGWFM